MRPVTEGAPRQGTATDFLEVMLETLSEDKRDRFPMTLWNTWVLAHAKRRACPRAHLAAYSAATDANVRPVQASTRSARLS